MQKIINCLLIDDDLDDQEIFKMCIKKISKDINCMSAHDGTEAIELLDLNNDYIPDYIFLDINMPKMNGIACLKELKKIERIKNSKIFIYSTTSEEKTVTESRNLGASDFIIKQSKTLELKEKLAIIFEIVSESINK